MNTVKLRDIANIYIGNSINKSEKQKKYMRDVPGWNYIATKDVDFDGTVTYKNGVVIPFTETKFKTAPAGTVFVCSEGGSAGKKTALITEEVCFGNKLFALVNDKGLFNPKYLFYYTRYEGFLKQFKVLATSLMGGISLKNFGNIEVPMPNLEVQSKMVGLIDEQLSSLDNAVETLNKTKEQLAVYRQAVLKKEFSGDWSFDKAENLCEFITKGTTPKKSEMFSGNGEVPFIKVYNLTFDNSLDFTIDPTYVSKETHEGFLVRSKVLPGDVLMNIVGPPMGKVSIVPDKYPEWNINQAIARFRCKEKLLNKFLAYYLGFAETVEKMMKQSKATAGQFNLTLEICRNIMIPVPDYETQEKIVYEIETKMSVCEEIERTVDEALQQAKAMRQSILKEVFEGRL